jgi:ribosomal protein L20
MKDNPFRRAIASRKQLAEPILVDPAVAEPILAEVTLAEVTLAEVTLAEPTLRESHTSAEAEPLAMPVFPEIERPLVKPTDQPETFPQVKSLLSPEVSFVPEPEVQPKAANLSNLSSSRMVEELSRTEVDVPRKRGRPATGKRSDGAWVGRTYYIKRETDLDIGEVILQLRRQGIEVDKSELVDLLLSAWVKWHKGENIEIHLSEVSPIQK